MNLTANQKKSLVSASIATAVFVACDELVFPAAKGKRKGGKPVDSKTWLASVASGLAGFYYYDDASPETKGYLEKYAIPTGAAAASFIAVNRFAMPKIKPGVDARPYALGAAAIAAWFTRTLPRASDGTTVGMLAERSMKAPYPPAFGPTFEPEFEG